MIPDKKYFLALAGNIGSGKTTLTTIIAEKFGWTPFYESVVNNPYLDDFYKDMSRWSFHLEVYFLSHRLKAMKKMNEQPGSCVQDRTLDEDAEVFSRVLFEQGSLSKRDYDNYLEYYKYIGDLMKKPDLIIYLQTSVDTLLFRIKKRGGRVNPGLPRNIYSV